MGLKLSRILLIQLPKDLFAFGVGSSAYFGRKLLGARHLAAAMPAGLTPIEDISQLSPRVCRLLGSSFWIP
jgi:hypothetical protein